MLNSERWEAYRLQRRLPQDRLFAVTSAQIRRMKHKQFSRKTHQHIPGEIPACQRCKPGWMPARLRRLEQQA